MSDTALSVSEAVERLSRHDPILKVISLFAFDFIDSELTELADCLLAHPDVATNVLLGFNQLTDETGIKLARYLAASSTIELLDLSHNQFSDATYLALAAALRVNSSLLNLNLYDNQAVDRTRIDAAFVEALRLNHDSPADSVWWLYSSSSDFERLKHAADELGHPSLLLLLTDDRPTLRPRLGQLSGSTAAPPDELNSSY